MRASAALAASLLPLARAGGYEYIELDDPSAMCLDGSRYGFAICPGSNTSTLWEISHQGGGWCYSEADCAGRANTSLGSSSTWPAETRGLSCQPGGDTTSVQLFYGDGASFSGYREEPWPVPGASQSLWFRGIRNIDATMDRLFKDYRLGEATTVVITGGSAGGLATFLHVDHYAERITAVAPSARVVGRPLCGLFIDHGNDGNAAPNVTYPLRMQYVFGMQNASGSLSKECQAYYGKDAWRCIMAQYAAPFINTPWFALQSRTDHWQLSEIAMIPCMLAQPYAPPYKPSSCTKQEDAAIQEYSKAFMAAYDPLRNITRNSIFLDACIIHGSTNSSILGKNNMQAFDAWMAGDNTQYVMTCNGSETDGPCDPSPICAPFP